MDMLKKPYVETRGRRPLYAIRALLIGDIQAIPIPIGRQGRCVQTAIITAARRAGMRVHTSVRGDTIDVIRTK